MDVINVDAVFVVHVKRGYDDREKHINQHLPSRGISNFEYMLEGDVDDLSDEIIDSHFSGLITESKANMSCAYKHFLIYKSIVERGLKTALILEDDIFLDKDFISVFNQCVVDLPESKSGVFINFERAGAYVPRIIKRSRKFLYRSKENRLNGAYFVDASAANNYYQYMLDNKYNLPADWMITKMSNELQLPIYWCEPTIAEQGSKNGMFASQLSGRKKGLYQRIKWVLNRFYKQHVYSNISLKNISRFK